MRKIYLLVLVFAAVAFLILTSSNEPAATPFHSHAELDAFNNGKRQGIDSGEYFLGSNRCRGCHGYDSLHQSNIDALGNDINLYDDWESTMMALSAKDPFWRAKVSHEILVDPGHSVALQNKCTSCHAPMGHFTAIFKGMQTYTLADLLTDTLGLNGVACGGCHEIGKDTIGSLPLEFSGNIHYDTSKVEYGPFENPLTGPMELYVGLKPQHSLHMSRSQICAPCHTLQTASTDLNGNLTGHAFVEQATFHEWLNSDFNSDQPCQSCHMPQIQDPVVIANNILNLPPRSPFNLHKFTGANTFMLQLIKQNKIKLGVDVADSHFDSTITGNYHMLRTQSLEMLSQIDSIANDTLYVTVELTNKAGHKFPSGYPSRRAFIQLAVVQSGDTVFQSGMLQPDYEVAGQGSNVEPHYNIIDNESQVQIYEMVMGDVNSHFTTVLERADVTLKDNRLPPVGFRTTHYAYDTVKIVGEATADADFNKAGGNEGTGKDLVHYHIPLNNASGLLHISSAVYYQTLPPRWLQEMFTHSSDFIDSFRHMYQGADKSLVLVASSELDTTRIVSANAEIKTGEEWRVFPVLTTDGNVLIENNYHQGISNVEIWDAAGRKVNDLFFDNHLSAVQVRLPNASGIYYLRISSGKNRVVKKVIRGS